MKILILSAFIAVFQLTQTATLRRKPKIYNALITTDQNLTPSRAYPVIQPHLQETYAYPSYSYRSYSPFGSYNTGIQYGSAAASTISSYNGFHSYPRGLVEARNYFPRDEISTIPPSFGLPPPSIVPVNSFGFGHNSINLAPYPYSSYPLIYDQFSGHGGYLSPFQFYPTELDGSSIGPDKGTGNPNNDDLNNDNGNAGASSGSNAISDNGTGSGGESSSAASGGSSGGGDGSSSGGGGGSSSGGGGGSSSGGGVGSSGGRSGGGGGGGTSGGGSSSSSTSTKSGRARNFHKSESQRQLLNESIKNFANKDPSIPDVPPPPLPSGAKAVDN